MFSPVKALSVIVLANIFAGSLAIANQPTADECSFIREKIKNLPAAGGKVDVPAGVYNCKAPIIIDRSHVELAGAGKDKTIFRLADWVHAPLLVVGDVRTVRHGDDYLVVQRVNSISLHDFSLDGNKDNHDTSRECGETHCDGDTTSIRNNSLSIRGASHVQVVNVASYNSISGGMVTEKHCDHLYVENFESYGNFFDGFAGYETEKSVFREVYLHDNKGAGISIDIRFNNNYFVNSVLRTNHNVGIFARELRGNVFDGVRIENSGNYGMFLASSVTDDQSRCATENVFNDLIVSGSVNYAVRINDKCPGNKFTGFTSFLNNKGCISTEGNIPAMLDPTVTCRQ